MMTTVVSDPLSAARSVADILRLDAAGVDDTWALSSSTTTTLRNTGIFRAFTPRSLGGLEADPMRVFDAIEVMSYADGSVGWCAMLGGALSALGGMMPADGAAELFTDPDTIVAGSFDPNCGVAIEAEGGYRLSGRWPLASGSCHANWFICGAVILRDGAPVMLPHGVPLMREFLVPVSAVNVIDTWDSTGLRGTASNDFAVEGVFVPQRNTVWFAEPPVETGPLYRMPPIAMFAALIAAVPLGVARHAIDEFVAMAATKVPVMSQAVLADKAVSHAALGRAKVSVDASRTHVRSIVQTVWDKVVEGRPPTLADRGELWNASAYAGHTALAAIDALYTAAGATSVYRRSPLDRCLRDARTAVQHVCLQEQSFELMGRMMNGRDSLASVWGMDYRGEI